MRADQTVGGPEWCTVYKREAAEARRPPLKSTHAGSGWCFSHTAKGSYFSALLCALERSGCEDAFEQKETKLTKGYESSGCGVSKNGRKLPYQTVGGPEWCTVYKREAAEARRPPKGIILPLNRWPSVKAVDERGSALKRIFSWES